MEITLKDNTFTFSFKKFFKVLFGVIAGYLLCFFLLLLALRWVNPPFTAFTLMEDWEEIGAERYDLNDYWIPDENIPKHMKLAAISSEDQHFRNHWGLDLEAIGKVVNEREETEKRRGASTITQQVAKNLFLTPARTYFRKGIEAIIAVTIEQLWSKERILEMYLNIVEFGPGVFGIGKASEHFYDSPPPNLTPMEAAQLAAVLPSPKRMTAEPPSPFVQERSRWILRQMTHLSGISYLPKPQPTSPQPNPDTTEIASQEFTESQIRRAEIPDSLVQISNRDPLLDSARIENLEIW